MATQYEPGTVGYDMEGAQNIIDAKGGELSALGKMYESKGYQTPKPLEPIDANIIGQQSTTFQAPVPQVSTKSLSRLEAGVEPSMAPAETVEGTPQRPQDSIVQRQLDLIDQIRGKGERSQAIMEEQRVLEKKQALDLIDQDITKRENYYTRKMERLEDRGGGWKMGFEAEMNTLRRERARELADMYIIRAGKAQDYETANQYAQDLIAAEFEPLQDEIDNLSAVYNLMQNDLSESEKLMVEAQIDQKKADRQNAMDTASSIYSELANAGALTPDRTRVLNQAMQEATAAISRGESPDAALAKMQNTMVGVQTLAGQKAQADIAQGWQSLALRGQELELSKTKFAAELLSETGNEYGTLDAKPQTAAQALVNGYADRLLQAEGIFSTVANQFADPLAMGGVLPNVLQSSERQQYEQAKRNFVNAVLRRESGAVISDQEFDNAEKQYFPQAGDSATVIEQKANNRNTVINSFYKQANVPRPVFAGDIITDDSTGKKYRVEEDGITLTEI